MNYKYIKIIAYTSLLIIVSCSVMIVSRSDNNDISAETSSVKLDSTTVGPTYDLSRGAKTKKSKDSIN